MATALRINFPEHLPVSARRGEIEAALARHQVVIVCGETGSGKTTQLPKIVLGMRGRDAPGLIGHTQPRRIAATSVARRIAEELGTEPGAVVGYKIRFQDRLAPDASIKLMTDGILLAETQGDPQLRAYHTLIIDEAHERSLNIDFLLGYLKRLLPQRPDLKLIVTSATIDAQRFAEHFADARGPAPVLVVSGRTFPVEQRWRPWEEGRGHGLNEAIADAVDELWQGRVEGDILVFLPGEGEIRDAAQHLRKHLQRSAVLRSAEVLPLFARLSQAEQARIFQPHAQPRIVLATNVAETSLTVPGIRFVIDAGTARVKRYSYRSKVERLLVEHISQAAAEQRAGRCGRTAGGICIRLYDEQDFQRRPRFTDPEILRSSLAGVILRMKSLGLVPEGGSVLDFPFLEPPSGRAVADGLQLLAELNAVDEAGRLTEIGRELGRLPLDPRLGRMLLAARERGALREVLVIASALSVRDVRDRPIDREAQADQQHAKFDDERSEFSGYLKLWQWLEDARGGKAARSRREMQEQHAAGTVARKRPRNLATLPPAKRAELALQQARAALGARGERDDGGGAGRATRKLSNRQWEALLRQNFINVRRVREWRSVHQQLRAFVRGRHWRENERPAGYDAVHKALLAGLLGNLGCRIDSDRKAQRRSASYLGARGIKFDPHPGNHLSRRPERWIVCAELVETSRLFGRGIAGVDPRWLEEIAGHLLHRQVDQPHWEKKAADVIAFERGLLYGLVVYQGRRVHYGRVDPAGAREILIRQALVEGDWPPQWERTLSFLSANRKLIAQVRALEHQARRPDLLVDDELIYAFYEKQIPADVSSGPALLKWYKQARRKNSELLRLNRELLLRHEETGVSAEDFPPLLRLGGVDCSASYLHAPGDDNDGLTVKLPLVVLNQVDAERAEWLVPGMLAPKVEALLRTLSQKLRHRLRPLPETAVEFSRTLQEGGAFGQGDLRVALAELARERSGLMVRPGDFKLTALQPHLFMNFVVEDGQSRRLGQGRSLERLRGELGAQASGAFQALARLRTRPPEAAQAVPANDEEEGGADEAAGEARPAKEAASYTLPAGTRYTTWDFGPLPELMELRQEGGQTLVGFPALVDQRDAVVLEVFDDPQVAAQRHHAGLRRLFALQVADALRQLRRDLPGLQRMAVHYMSLGTQDELREQIVQLALDQVFMSYPLPTDAEGFAERAREGRTRLILVAGEVARLAATILQEYAIAQRRIKESRRMEDAAADASEQLARLMPADFLTVTPWAALRHFPRYLQAVALRFEKMRGRAERDTELMRIVQAQEQRLWRLVARRRGKLDERLQELRWMLEELRVSLFAQELRTPHPVSVKRLEKVWARLGEE